VQAYFGQLGGVAVGQDREASVDEPVREPARTKP
jgi:hypothetical protein